MKKSLLTITLALSACGGGGYDVIVKADPTIQELVKASNCPVGTYYDAGTCYPLPVSTTSAP